MTKFFITGGAVEIPDDSPVRGNMVANLSYVRIPEVPVYIGQPFAHGYGICVHPTFIKSDNVYSHTDAWFQRCVVDLGVKTIRGLFSPNSAGSRRVLELCRQHGVKWIATLIPEDWSMTEAELRARCRAVNAARDVIIMVELMNEPNHSRDGAPIPSNWPWQIAQQALIVREELPGMFILSSALHQAVRTVEQDHYRLGDALREAGMPVDGVSVHDYDGGRAWNKTGERLDLTEDAFGLLDGYVISEYGRHNAVNVGRGKHAPNSEWAAGQYAVRDVIRRLMDPRVLYVMQYEGLDDPKPLTEHEAHFGLLRTPSLDPATWSPKLSFHSLRQMIALTNAWSPGTTGLPVLIEAGAAEVESLVTHVGGQDPVVWLWQDVSVYDVATRQDTPPELVRVRLTTPTGTTEVEVNGRAQPFTLP